jgi:hypothetical protein
MFIFFQRYDWGGGGAEGYWLNECYLHVSVQFISDIFITVFRHENSVCAVNWEEPHLCRRCCRTNTAFTLCSRSGTSYNVNAENTTFLALIVAVVVTSQGVNTVLPKHLNEELQIHLIVCRPQPIRHQTQKSELFEACLIIRNVLNNPRFS